MFHRLMAHGLQQALHVADRRFRAHVTVGRVRGADGPARATVVTASLVAHTAPTWTPSGITLVESVTGPAPAYHVLARWPLRQPRRRPGRCPGEP